MKQGTWIATGCALAMTRGGNLVIASNFPVIASEARRSMASGCMDCRVASLLAVTELPFSTVLFTRSTL